MLKMTRPANAPTSTSADSSSANNCGGRLIKWKGKVASLSPTLGSLTGSISSLAVAALAGGGLALSAGGAFAGTCTETSLGSGVWTCSGEATVSDTIQVLSGSPLAVTTTEGFGLTATGPVGFDLTGTSGLTFTDNFQAAISGTNVGMRAVNGGSGAISITTTGAVVGGWYGISAANLAGATDLTISAASVSGGGTGIIANNAGSGALSITTSGAVVGTSDQGIYAANFGTDLTISAVSVAGGISPDRSPYGFETGIVAFNRGSGALSIATTGDVVGGYGYGILAINDGTDLTISAANVTGGTDGINVRNDGSGVLNITTTGDVTGGAGDGIYALNSDYFASAKLATDLTISAASVSGGADGINARHYGSGELSITATGDVSGETGSGISASILANNGSILAALGTDLTISATNVTGGTNGIAASNFGSGALSITTTGEVKGATSNGIVAIKYYGTDVTISAASVTGGSNGIFVYNFGSGTLSITTTGAVEGTTGSGIIARSRNDATIDVAGLVTGGNGTAINMTNVSGDATLALRSGWGLSGQALGSVTRGDTLLLTGSAAAALDLAQIGDALNLNAILGFENFIKDGDSDWTLSNTQGNDGFLTAELRSGGLILDNATFGMDLFDPLGTTRMDVGTLGTLHAIGAASVAGNLRNAGAVSMSRNGVAADTFTITGDYVGESGSLLLDSVLNGDSSATDLFVVEGNVTGQTSVFVTNTGGVGAQTITGIKLVEVGGTSTADAFALGAWDFETDGGERALISGAYGYVLQQGTDASWYLTSEPLSDVPVDPPLMQPAAPIYETFAQIGGSLSQLPSLQQRQLGNARDSAPVQVSRGGLFGMGADSTGQTGAWARIEGARDRVVPVASTSGASFDTDITGIQLGMDRAIDTTLEGALIGGVSLRYVSARSDVSSDFGDGKVDTTGLGLGGNLTLYRPDGFYVDGQIQAMWLSSDIASDTLGTLIEGTEGVGYGLSVEIGRTYAMSENWSITPQAQLSYARTALDAFTDAMGVRVTPEDVQSGQLRLGVVASHEQLWQAAGGTTSRRDVQLGLDLIREAYPETVVDVDGTTLRNERDDLLGGISLRSSYSWRDDRHTVFAELAAATGLNSFGDSDTTRLTLGFQSQW